VLELLRLFRVIERERVEVPCAPDLKFGLRLSVRARDLLDPCNYVPYQLAITMPCTLE
jgi:hypothetical protein